MMMMMMMVVVVVVMVVVSLIRDHDHLLPGLPTGIFKCQLTQMWYFESYLAVEVWVWQFGIFLTIF